MLIADAELPDGRHRDVAIEGETITAVKPEIDATGHDVVIDAGGDLLMPGAIDVHVHFRQPGFAHKETWASGSRAAAAGGVTTVVDQPNTDPPTVTGEAVSEKADLAADSIIDFGINGGVTPDWDPDSLLEAPIFALGEIFLADSTGDMGIDAEAFADAVSLAADTAVPVTVHAEDATRFDEKALEAAGDGQGASADADAWSAYRQPEAEVAAIERAIEVADGTGADVHIAHTSTPAGIDAAAEAGLTCEVTPHHAFLSRADLDELGTYGRMNPPLRDQSRQEAVWERVVDGTVDMVATDHAPHTTDEKENSIKNAPSGVPGVETMVPLLLAAAIEGDLTIERVRDLVASNPARIFDCQHKGHIAPGYHADLALYDLTATRTILGETLQTACGWTPFKGWDGVFPRLTLVRGTVAYADPEDDRMPQPDDGEFGPAIGDNVREQ